MAMQASGEAITLEYQFVILLGSLSNDYDNIVKIIENIQRMDLFCAKEMLHREYEGLIRKEESESALRATRKMYTLGARKQNQKNMDFKENASTVENMGTGRSIAGKIELYQVMKEHSSAQTDLMEDGYWTVVPVATCVRFKMNLRKSDRWEKWYSFRWQMVCKWKQRESVHYGLYYEIREQSALQTYFMYQN
uniref:AlNc14C754G12487 protein n=1 Tax=Albugo laibachii Nc14 TaxID=890382 RepID=F0X202_9STRA|nr:AlNc14C754G12487 [Albugo laibachii Nc14]|eukprot:CCA27862.1 AlNc14C754G12487 [Albugo laibachii Nc14]